MIAELEKINPKVLNIVLYVQNDAMQYYARNILKKKFNCPSDYVLDVTTSKEHKRAVNDAVGGPPDDGSWIISVDTSKISKADVLKDLKMTPYGVVTVYWVNKYSLFKAIQDSDIVKRQGTYCYTNYFGRLTDKDVYQLLSKDFQDMHRKPLDSDLLAFVAKNYLWDVQAVFDLVAYLKSGNEFETTKDIIETIGLGGNTVDSFTVNLLLSNVKTLKGKKSVIRKHLKTLNDLSTTYKYGTIKNFMLNTVNGFIDMKQLQIMGLYRKGHYKIPENYDSARLLKLRRYEWAVLDRLTLGRLLLLKQCLMSVDVAYVHIGLLKAVVDFIDALADTTQEEKLALSGVKPDVKPRNRKKGSLKKKIPKVKTQSAMSTQEEEHEEASSQMTYTDMLKEMLYGGMSINEYMNTVKNREESK